MILEQRILHSDNGTLTDISIEINDYDELSFAIPLVAGEDYIYMGSYLPFNHKYFSLDNVNDQAATPTIEIWNSNAWRSAVDILDYTKASGVSFAKDGDIQFRPYYLYGWDRVQRSKDVTGLTGTDIYDMYWSRISFSANLAAGAILKFIGHKFAKDSELYQYYPDLNNTNLMAAFKAGKTDWDDQHFLAAKAIIRELISRNLIISPDQILDVSVLNEAAIHKTAEIIYGGLGPNNFPMRDKSKNEFRDALNLDKFKLDKSKDGEIDDADRNVSTGELTR